MLNLCLKTKKSKTMTEDESISPKRMKLNSDDSQNERNDKGVNCSNCMQIQSILPDELTHSVEQCYVYTGTIKTPKLTATIIGELSQRLPLKELNHLKRVNKSKVVVCSVNTMIEFCQKNQENGDVSELMRSFDVLTTDNLIKCDQNTNKTLLQLFLSKQNISNEVTSSLCTNIELITVPAFPPTLRWQYEEALKRWPCKFYPNKMLESLSKGSFFSADETKFHIKMIEICRFLCKELNKSVAGIAIDPRTNSLVAIGFDEIEQHPLMHCPMVLIDCVARTQAGGAWTNHFLNINEKYQRSIYTNSDNDLNESTTIGISPYIQELINRKFDSIKYGAERVKGILPSSSSLSSEQNTQTELPSPCSANNGNDNLAKYGPYLCTGYDIYLLREPCTMCSMALTHSRIRRLFFHERYSSGAICSLVKLQSIKALNHHFQAFHIM